MPGLYETFFGFLDTNVGFAALSPTQDEGYPTTETRAMCRLATRVLGLQTAVFEVQMNSRVTYREESEDYIQNYEWAMDVVSYAADAEAQKKEVADRRARNQQLFVQLAAIRYKDAIGSTSVFERMFRAVVKRPRDYEVLVTHDRIELEHDSSRLFLLRSADDPSEWSVTVHNRLDD